jgi:hypothetical protein
MFAEFSGSPTVYNLLAEGLTAKTFLETDAKGFL